MKTRSFRPIAVAAITAIVGFATQANTSPGTDATLSPLAWTVSRGEATEFQDAMARDSMASRAEVRHDMLEARAAGRLADTGEAGATERVLAKREAHVRSEHDRLVALNAPAAESDELGEMIAAMAERDSWNDDTYALAPQDDLMMPATDQDSSFASTAGIGSLDDSWTSEYERDATAPADASQAVS
jgi:hypothetical protein